MQYETRKAPTHPQNGLRRRVEQRRAFIVAEALRSKLLTFELLDRWHGHVGFNVRLLVRDFGFDRRRVLDIGCSYGNSVLYWGEGSEGIEVNEEPRRFVGHFGVKTHARNVEDGLEGVGEPYEAVYTNNLIEHLVAPHLFLARLHRLLAAGGLLALSHPTTPSFPFDVLWTLLGYRGWLAVEHINFFTPASIQLALQRAGFRVVRQYLKPFDRLHVERVPVVARLMELACVHVLTVCAKFEGYKYPGKRLDVFDPTWAADCREFR